MKELIDAIVNVERENIRIAQEAAATQKEMIKNEFSRLVNDLLETENLAWIRAAGNESIEFQKGREIEWSWRVSPGQCKTLEIAFVSMLIEGRYDTDLQFGKAEIVFYSWNSSSWELKKFVTQEAWLSFARSMFDAFMKKGRKDAVSALDKKYGSDPFLTHYRNIDLPRAIDYHSEICKADPTRIPEWDEKLEAVKKAYAEQEEREKQEEIAQEHQDWLAAQYKTAYQQYVRQCAEIYLHNREVARKVQEKILDQPHTAYKLTYALVAADEEGGKLIDTQTVWVRSAGTKEKVFTTLTDEVIKFYNPVSLEKFEIVAGKIGSTYGCVSSFKPETPGFLPNIVLCYFVAIGRDVALETLNNAGLKPFPEFALLNDLLEAVENGTLPESVIRRVRNEVERNENISDLWKGHEDEY